MPSITIYISSDEIYFRLKQEPNPSKLIESLLREYFERKDREEVKEGEKGEKHDKGS